MLPPRAGAKAAGVAGSEVAYQVEVVKLVVNRVHVQPGSAADVGHDCARAYRVRKGRGAYALKSNTGEVQVWRVQASEHTATTLGQLRDAADVGDARVFEIGQVGGITGAPEYGIGV